MSYNKVPPDPTGGGGGGSGDVTDVTAGDADISVAGSSGPTPAVSLVNVGGVAKATVASGAALGTTSVQPATSPTLSGLTVTNGANGSVTCTDAASFFAARVNPATAGSFRCANGSGVFARNAANSANIRNVQVDASDQLLVGENTAANVIHDVAVSGSHFLKVNGATVLTVAATLVTAAALRVSSLGAGIGHYDGSGNLTSSTIVNADIDAAAAITGTKIAPNFGSQAVVTTGAISCGTNPATTATGINLPGNAAVAIAFRNAANSADAATITCSATNVLTLAAAAGITISNGLTVASTATFSSTVSFLSASVSWSAAVVSPALTQATDATASVTCDDLKIVAQSGSGTTAVTAGSLGVIGGSATGGSGTRNGGNAYTQPGTGATTNGESQMRNAAATPQVRVNSTGLAFFNVAPVAQPADVGAITDSTGGSADGTLVDVGVAFSQANVNNNFADLAAKYNTLRTNVIRALGLTA